MKKIREKKDGVQNRSSANQIAITKSIGRDSSRWRCSITGSALLGQNWILAKTFCPRHVRTNCYPSTDDKRRRNFHADDRASMEPHLSWRPHLFSTTQVFHPNCLFLLAAATGIARCQVAKCVLPSKVIPLVKICTYIHWWWFLKTNDFSFVSVLIFIYLDRINWTFYRI